MVKFILSCFDKVSRRGIATSDSGIEEQVRASTFNSTGVPIWTTIKVTCGLGAGPHEDVLQDLRRPTLKPRDFEISRMCAHDEFLPIWRNMKLLDGSPRTAIGPFCQISDPYQTTMRSTCWGFGMRTFRGPVSHACRDRKHKK